MGDFKGAGLQASVGGVRARLRKPVVHFAEQAQSAFLDVYDPVRALGLHDDSVFYRCTERKWVKNNAMKGHPDSGTMIDNHHFVQDDPVHAAFAHMGMSGRRQAHMPVSMQARDLKTPVLNVMHGDQARGAAQAYRRSGGDRVTVEMRLGDFRRAGGGEVYVDPGAAAAGEGVTALIVTLPKGKAVPVQIVE